MVTRCPCEIENGKGILGGMDESTLETVGRDKLRRVDRIQILAR